MKLRVKIQLSFFAPVIILLIAIGLLITSKSKESTQNNVLDSMSSSATLASKYISQQLSDYMNVVEMLGKSEQFCTDFSLDDKIAYFNTYVEKFGFTSVNILDKKGISMIDGTDFSTREYVQKALSGTVNISDVAISKYTGKYGVSIAAPLYDSTLKTIKGVVYFRIELDFIIDILKSINVSDNSYAFIVDSEGNIIAHPNEELVFNLNLYESGSSVKALVEKLVKGETGNARYNFDGEELLSGFCPVDNTNGWSIVVSAPMSDYIGSINRIRNIVFMAVILATVIVLVISTLLARLIVNPIERVKKALIEVSKGNFNTDIDKVDKKDEVSVLQNTTYSLIETLSGILGQANSSLDCIARYDLTAKDMNDFPGEFNTLAVSVNSIKSTLKELITEIQNAVYSVDTGSRELAQATAALSQGTVTQASSIQTLADDLNVIVEKIKLNSVREGEINENLSDLDLQIQKANGEMQNLLKVVDDIKVMSSSILKIVDSIDSIAFQTNILSLNASVEAARAGEMGSGFAVVAQEIRALAEKCGESSKKTSELINECIKNIENAKACADTTFESLSAVVDNSSKIASTFKGISEDTSEQADKSARIQNEVNAISDVVQTNTATVEETAASTSVLSEQAMHLEEMIRNFRTE